MGPHFVHIQWHSLVDVYCHGNSEDLADCLNSLPLIQSEHAVMTSTNYTELLQDCINGQARQEGLGPRD